MKKEIQEEVKGISPGFPIRDAAEKPALPDGYFERMQDEVIGRLRPEKRSHARIRFLFHWQRVAAIALIAAGIFFIGRKLAWQGRQQAMEPGVELTRAEALDYALEHPGDFVPLLEDMNGDILVDELFPGTAIREWDDEALEQMLDDLSDESIDDLL